MTSLVSTSGPATYVREYFAEKVVIPSHLASWRKKMRERRCTVASLNGSFDLLHAGHLEIIYQASLQADVLIVALNTDASIAKYKSPKRPLVPLQQRMELMAALGFVDFVTYFEETDPRKVLSVIQPDCHVNGAEYGKDCIEADIVKEFGGRVHIVERVEGFSTSKLVEKIQKT